MIGKTTKINRFQKSIFVLLAIAFSTLCFTKQSSAQVMYNESFEITNGSAVTYPLASLPIGWNQFKYCTPSPFAGYPAGNCFSTSVGFSRYGAGSINPAASPRTGSTMLGFNSYSIFAGEKAYVVSKKLDIATVGASNVTGSVWIYRDNGFATNADSISILVYRATGGPALNAANAPVNVVSGYPRSCTLPTAGACGAWEQISFTIPNSVVATWAAAGMYVAIMGHSQDGNNIYLDDFSVQEYPAAAPTVVAAQTAVTLQNTATTQPNQLNQLIIGCKIQTTGSNATTGTKLTINNWTFNTNGSNNPPTDISAAKLWWTGGTNAFDPSLAIQIGTVANPWATNYTFLSTAWGGGADSSRWLQYGDNYFWITYDIAPTAVSGNFVDAEWVSGQFNGASTLSISPQSLAGARLIDLTYCIPAYAVGTAWAGYSNNDYIQCVQLDDFNGTGGINNGPLGNLPATAAGPCAAGAPCGFQSHPPDYEFFLPAVNKTAILTAANTYQIKVACGTWFSANYIAAWIDYNKTGTFTNTLNIGATATLLSGGGGEKICQSPSLVNSGGSCTGPAGSNFTQTFTIPADALPGNTRLRVREVYATSQIDPCAFATYGETEDYVVTIIPPCAPAWIGWKTWLGFTEDWNNPANWCGGVPTINDNARIPVYGAGPNDRPGLKMPRIKSGIDAVAKTLRIESPATASDTSAFLIDAAAIDGSTGIATASLTASDDILMLSGAKVKVISDLRDTAQLMNGVLRTPTVPSTNEPFSNVIKKRNFYVLTQSDILSEGIVANDVIDTILIHVKRNGTSTEPMRNFTVKYYYTDGTVPGFIFNGAPFTGVAATNYRNMPPTIGPAPVTIYGPANLATSTFIPTTGQSGTIILPLVPGAFKWNGSTNKLVIEITWDNTGFAVPLGGTEGTTFTQTSTQGYRHAIGISETKVTNTYNVSNFVVPFSALPQTSTAGAITWTAGTNTMASTYANATFAVGQWVSGTGISVNKAAIPVNAGNATINIATGTAGILPGMYINGSGWAAGVAPQVVSVAATSVVVTPAPTTTVASATLTFCPYITALSSANPPYSTITLNCNLPGSTTAGNLNIGALHTTPTVGADYRSNLTFKVRRPYGKFPIEVRKDWVNNGTFEAGISRVSMTTPTAGVVDSMFNVNPTSFYDLVINNTDGVKMYAGDITIQDTL
ncbi:MAG: GEVED domain-containing protein, partial [Bacteroidota bacterium]